MFKDFFLRQAVKAKMKDATPEARAQMEALVTANPDLMKRISEEVERRVKKGGENEMKASIEVMKKYAPELREALGIQPKVRP